MGSARCDADNLMPGWRWFGGNDHFGRLLNHDPFPNYDPAATSCDEKTSHHYHCQKPKYLPFHAFPFSCAD